MVSHESKSRVYPFILLLIAILPFGQLGRISLYPNIAFYMHDVLIGIIALLVLPLFLKNKIKLNFLFKPLLFFVGSIVVSLLLAFNDLVFLELFTSSLYIVRWIGYLFVFFGVFTLNSFEKKQVLRAVFLQGIVFGLLGLTQFLLYPDLRNIIYAGWDPHLGRLFGTFLDPNFAGIYIVLHIILGVFLYKESKSTFVGGGVLFLVCLLFLTYSRGSFLAFLTILGMYAIFFKKKLLAVLGATIFFAVLLMLPRSFGEGVRLERTSTIVARFQNWSDAGSLFLQSPLFGVGFNTYRYRRGGEEIVSEYPDLAGGGVDNSYLFILVTSGIFGLVSYIYLWYFLARFSMKVYRDFLIFPVLGALGVHAFFTNTLFYPWNMIWLWIIVGVSVEKEVNRT